MTSPFNKLKKIRSWDEIRTRGSQVVSAYSEKIGFGDHVPTDTGFERLVDKQNFGVGDFTAENVWARFYTNANDHFFASFADRTRSAEAFRRTFPASAERFIDAAEAILAGRLDLFGLKGLFIGTDVDWHLEPSSGIRSPMKHWREFDELDAAESGDKKIIWELNRHQHFFTLGVAFWLTGDERFAAMFAAHLEGWMNQNPPGTGINWVSSLEVSFRAMSWIWAFQFFRHANGFPPDLLLRAVKHLYLHGRHIEKYLSKYYSPNTHLTGEALGLYYLGTQLPFLERSVKWRKMGEQILFDEIPKQIFDDGVYFEQSTWYQRYTVDFYTQFIALRSLNDGQADGTSAMTLESRIESALEFMMHATRPDGTTPIIGDDDGGRALPLTSVAADDFRGTLGAGAAILGRGDMKCVAAGRNEEVFWLFGPAGLQAYSLIEEHEPAATSKAFPAGGCYTMRDGWLDTDNFVMVDCGPVGALAGGHGHADALAVEVVLHGKKLLVDSGTYSYHASREMRDYFRSTKAHNTVTVDERSSSEPGGKFSWKTRAESTLSRWATDERFDYFEGVQTGYERLENAATQTRSVFFLKNDYLVIRDLIRAKGDHEYSLNYHFPVDMRFDLDAERGFAGNDDWRMFVVGDGGEWLKRESWISNSYGNKTNAPFLRFVSKGRSTQEFFTVILPVDPGQDEPSVREVAIDGGRAFAITHRGYTDMLIYNDDLRKPVSTELFDSNFRITWARVGSRSDTPEEYVLINGRTFDLGRHEVIGDEGDLAFATMRHIGSEMNVKTDRGRFRVSLP